ncbi:replication associated protein [Lake Sarah-associated circular virus-28]|uniref:replication associated protein n=1 Tax=Lake Sarah-associated circular virus-28 TaxID=1685755 RepID=UPI0007770515|nr:replication associated protein [Lake Sarah-associated circular virus-28]ALE29693.1 replication associated protein [Lake Sarah-associated circular virus-28]ALE29696.1 replication associated protein [Lake Sarah-associated circular virus-28]ALE29699.1 replication associated protein [Lake Sarah-associated circular virus-28]
MSDVVETEATEENRRPVRQTASQYKAWCYTFNNYSDADVERLKGCKDGIEVHVFGKEVGDSGTPHLQGFIKFQSRKRAMFVKQLIGGNAHVEYAKFPDAAIEYCKKDQDYFEYGALIKAGKRCDIDDFKSFIATARNEKRKIYDSELREEFPKLYCRAARFMKEYRDDNRCIEPPRVLHPLYEWQSKLNSELAREPDDRSITFIIDELGNSGKSWYATYYKWNHPETTQIFRPKKVADMAYELNERVRVVFMDCARAKAGEYLQYDFLEEIKDGMVFSPKYESRTKYLSNCHVVVLMNEQPDMTKLSQDRYVIVRI